jgi:hypothetical protein
VFTALLNCFVFLVSEGKRSGGITAVWVARNRFAVLDKTHTVWNIATNSTFSHPYFGNQFDEKENLIGKVHYQIIT